MPTPAFERVEYVVPDLPAHLNSNIERGDVFQKKILKINRIQVILTVDGQPATDSTVLSLIRGQVGSFTQLVYRKQDGLISEVSVANFHSYTSLSFDMFKDELKGSFRFGWSVCL